MNKLTPAQDKGCKKPEKTKCRGINHEQRESRIITAKRAGAQKCGEPTVLLPVVATAAESDGIHQPAEQHDGRKYPAQRKRGKSERGAVLGKERGKQFGNDGRNDGGKKQIQNVRNKIAFKR